MKKILLPILVACALAMPVRGQTILVVDVNNVILNLTEYKDQVAKITAARDQYISYLNDKASSLNALKMRVISLQEESQNQALTQDGRDSMHKNFVEQSASLDSQANDFQKDQQTSNTILTQATQTLIQTQLQKIRDEVAVIAAKKKATLVLNKSDNGLGTSVAFSDKSLDISTEVLDALNAAAAANTSSSSTLPALPVAPTAEKAASSAKPAAGSGSSK